MLSKVSHIFEYLYLGIFALSIYKIVEEWGQPESRILLYSAGAVVGVFMFIFKRRFRKRMEARQNIDK